MCQQFVSMHMGMRAHTERDRDTHTYAEFRNKMQKSWYEIIHIDHGLLVPRLGRTPGEGNGNPLQYSCLENPRDRGVWRATVHGVAKSLMQLCTSTAKFHILIWGHNQMLFQWMFILGLSKQRSPWKTGTKPYFYLCSPECLAKPWNSVGSNVNIC